ncbi:hypothetical protein NQ317_012557 [Molorchus minor]|uniref:Uncharacterized protein n=1 Tax=Molorchus minor TaxID=1323400 RepID=A0ABQ9K435_9CUCU|nr:hypothetical protein NQ317_012557 [Molorchus minor]
MMTGELLLKYGNDRNWWPRRVSIMGGYLYVSVAHDEDGPTSQGLPLRGLSLQAGPLPNSLSLCMEQNIVLTLQLQKDWNANDRLSSDTKLEGNCKSCKEQRQKTQSVNNNAPVKPQERQSRNIPDIGEHQVEDLLRRCQNVENYVPVKEKLFLFESLSKFAPKVRSTEDVSLKVDTGTKRARSLHDLSNISSQIAVREICKYFENKCDTQNDEQIVSCRIRRLVHSDSHLDEVYKCRKVFTT